MTQRPYDSTGAPVTVTLDESHPISAYTVNSVDGLPVGRADFLDSPDVDGERIFFHTEIARRSADAAWPGSWSAKHSQTAFARTSRSYRCAPCSRTTWKTRR